MESDCVQERALHWLRRKRREHFNRLPVAVQRQALRLQLIEQGIEPSFALLESLRNEPDVPVTFSPRKTLRRDSAGRVTLATSVPLKFSRAERVLSIAGRGAARFGKLSVEWQVGLKGGLARRASGAGEECFDAARVGPRIVLRHWRPGDRFQPIGMALAMKLQDLFVNQKIPAAQRRELVVATTTGGDIFWVEGLRIGEHAKLRATTRRRLVWKWRRA